MSEDISKIKKSVAHSDQRIFFELENGLYASAPMEKDKGNIILFPWPDIFLQYIYEDFPEPSEEQVKNAEDNYYKYGADARMLIVD